MISNIPTLSDSTYHIESELGSGGGGVVYKAWHMRLQKYVVIKELKSGSSHDIETQRNEVEALKNVKSEYLPQVFDFLVEKDRIYTVMEFIEGESFDKLLERGHKFTQAQVVKWYGQLVSAMEAIHKQDVYHRDIKPANIMLMPNGNVCLIDFNAALVSGNDVRLISRSLGYASPEQYEIYEQYKYARDISPINLGSSLIEVISTESNDSMDGGEDDKTELIAEDQSTEFISENIDNEKTEYIEPITVSQVDWKRSDVYSLGATMYHLLSGKRPSQRAAEVIPVSKLGYFSEGIVFIIEQSMQVNPAKRFASASVLSDAVYNIHKHDRRWRIVRLRKIMATIGLSFAFTIFATISFIGSRMMMQEREERYYATILRIGNDTNPWEPYNLAIEMFGDRIDPYLNMAKRLWNEGDLDTCCTYIEQNIGNISKFQMDEESNHSFGDIYFILGNCYYYRSGEPNYDMAKNNFAIAVQYVADNPIYYRDYAIALARAGDVDEAKQALTNAQRIYLESDSLNLLEGEINLAEQEYVEALDRFDKVISLTNDDYLRYRAYHAVDEIYRLLGKPECSVELLTDAISQIPLNRVPEMRERLADAYVKSGDYDKAIAIFEIILENGTPQFHIMQDLAILYQNDDKFEQASIVLNQMVDLYPNDFRVPMRQAFLEADIQSKKANEERDYSKTKVYYDNALKLYTLGIRDGEADPEMQQLELLMEQLRANEWIE